MCNRSSRPWRNKRGLDENILLDLETAISNFRNLGKVTAIGHSLGGRLALISSADYAIGLSPAASKKFSLQTEGIIKELRDPRVKRSNNDIFNILNELPLNQFKDVNSMIIHGSRDIPEITSASKIIKSEGIQVEIIEGALHNDIYLYEPVFEVINKKMDEWYIDSV